MKPLFGPTTTYLLGIAVILLGLETEVHPGVGYVP
jgi:hypothetical protein